MDPYNGLYDDAEVIKSQERFSWYHVVCAWALLILSWFPPASEVLALMTVPVGMDFGAFITGLAFLVLSLPLIAARGSTSI